MFSSFPTANRTITAVLALAFTSAVMADDAVPPARIAKFAGDRAAAISYTFDDGLRDQYTLAVPMLNEVGFKGTFFVIPGSTAETPEVQAAALKHHVAFRAYQTGLGEKSTVDSLDAWADKQVRDKTWGVLMAHAIAKGYAALSDPEILRAHLRHVKSREREIWVDTFANIARYEKERDDAKLEISGRTGNLTCLLGGTLDPRIFDVPLTLVIDAPGVTSARAQRAGSELPTRAANGSIHVEAAPGSQPITVTWK